MPGIWKHKDGSFSRIAVPYDGTQTAATVRLTDGTDVPVIDFKKQPSGLGLVKIAPNIEILSLDVSTAGKWSFGGDSAVIDGRKNWVGPSGPANNVLLLDAITSTAAYSLRKLRTAYSGAAIRVRRSSDNAEQDIGFASIGQNLATNGDFSNGSTGWVLSSATVSGGVLNITNGANFVYQQMGLIQGKKYWFSFDYTCNSGSALRICNSSVNGNHVFYTRSGIGGTSGKIQGGFIAPTSSGFFGIQAEALEFTGTIDNIIVREVGDIGNELDLHALSQFCIPTGGSQSSLQNAFVTTWYDQSGGSLNATQATATSQPSIVNAGTVYTLNNKPAVMGGTNTGLIADYAASLVDATTISVYRFFSQSTSYYNMMFSISPNNFTDSTAMTHTRAANNNSLWAFPTTTYGNNPQTQGAVYALATIKTAGGLNTFVNGDAGLASTDSAARATINANKITIGNRPAINSGWPELYTEFLFFNRAIAVGERASIEQSQGSYYGINL